MKKKSKRDPLKKRTIFTMLAIINITWYTIVVLIASFFDHEIQSDLTISWFAAWTAELALLYGIKVHEKSAGEASKKRTPIDAVKEGISTGMEFVSSGDDEDIYEDDMYTEEQQLDEAFMEYGIQNDQENYSAYEIDENYTPGYIPE